MSSRNTLVVASALGFLAVLMGAFGAHGLSDSGFLTEKYAQMEPKMVAGQSIAASAKYFGDFQTGVRYHMWHALALVGCGLMLRVSPGSKSLRAASVSFSLGILLFSGSLYVLVIGGPRFGGIPWGMVAPLGGTLLLVGWAALLLAVLRLPEGGAS